VGKKNESNKSLIMRTPITYYGGKQQLADIIIGMMPSHKIYCEPYFGGGAVFFAKGKSYLEVINDIDDRIITFYDVCQDEEKFLKLQQKFQNTLDSEHEFMRADKIWRHPENGYSDIETAWAVWYQCNMGYGGSPLGGWKWDNGTSGSHGGIVMDNYRNQFNYKVHERLKHVQISCRDALKVIAQRDSEDTFFFLDPPYPGCEQKHYSGFTCDDFQQRLDLLCTVKGKFILCSFTSPMLDDYIHRQGWHLLEKDMPLRVANRVTGGVKRKKEQLIWNYDIHKGLFE
jgi:DNA adenine methylase